MKKVFKKIEGSQEEKNLTFIPEKRIQLADGEHGLISLRPVRNVYQAAELIGKLFKDSDREVLCTLTLDSRLRPTAWQVISMGDNHHVLYSTSNVFKFALLQNASYVVLVHNDPNGFLKPSHFDYDQTRKMIVAGFSLDIPVMDHFIIADGYISSLRHDNPELFEYDYRNKKEDRKRNLSSFQA